MAGPLSLIAAASLYSSPYFQYWVLEAALARAPQLQPLLLCIILMFGPEGPVKEILSNVP